MSNIERWNKVREHRLCGKCLHAHNYKFCKASKKCGVNSCEAKHHPLLHREISSINTQTIEAGCNTHRQSSHSVIFRVIPIKLYGKGTMVETYAFLDDGSSLTIMEDDLANELQLKGFPEELCLKWTGDTVGTESNSKRVSC